MRVPATTGSRPRGTLRSHCAIECGWPRRSTRVPPLDLRLGDVVRLRKEHPCGATDFEVVRLGADIGLRCVGCGRRILLARSLLERRMERFVTRAPEHELPRDFDART
ncbi:MAG: DUF951 domain-containing protein [Chloroflexi bacterium]|nr:DUF951 domain-containing protein [Chloroflexota bacterium]